MLSNSTLQSTMQRLLGQTLLWILQIWEHHTCKRKLTWTSKCSSRTKVKTSWTKWELAKTILGKCKTGPTILGRVTNSFQCSIWVWTKWLKTKTSIQWCSLISSSSKGIIKCLDSYSKGWYNKILWTWTLSSNSWCSSRGKTIRIRCNIKCQWINVKISNYLKKWIAQHWILKCNRCYKGLLRINNSNHSSKASNWI